MKLTPPFDNLMDQASASDLFFNHTHPTFDALWGKDKEVPSHAQQRAAIYKDADEFVQSFGGDSEWFADDFMQRL